MSRLFLIALMVLPGLAGGGLWVYLVSFESTGPFHDNLVPELIGICIEGFLLVGLLTLIQRSREASRKHELWLSLRGSYRDPRNAGQHPRARPAGILNQLLPGCAALTRATKANRPLPG